MVVMLAGVTPGYALSGTPCVSKDNHIYYILTTSSAHASVTSVALTSSSAGACSESAAGNTVLTSIAVGTGGLLPNRMRTSVLRGLTSGSSCSDFDPAGAGGKGVLNLHVPSGNPARKVSASTTPGDSTEQVVDVHSSDATAGIAPSVGVVANVPAAFDSPNTSRNIGGCGVSGTTMAFPSPPGSYAESDQTTGEKSGQTVTFDDTKGTKVGNNTVGTTQPAPDGFVLEGNCSSAATCQVIVFIASQDSSPGFGGSAAGFMVDSNLIQSATESTANNGSFFTATPTPTLTVTSTRTPTATRTVTGTLPPTNTVTITPTQTSTPIPTVGLNDCCQCNDTTPACAAPVGNHCTITCTSGPPVAVANAVCLPPGVPGQGLCATMTPTPSPTSTPSFTQPPPPPPTQPPGPNDCCQCDGVARSCFAPIVLPFGGYCAGSCASGTPPVPVYNSVCVPAGAPAAGNCATVTPTPTPSGTPTPSPRFPSCVTHPEDFVPGGESGNECVQEICAVAQTTLSKRNLPYNIIHCKDDDPTCDFGASTGDHACTFEIGLCYNVTERRFPCALTGAIMSVHLSVPNEDHPKDAAGLAARDTIEAALVQLGGMVGTDASGHRSVLFDPAFTQRDGCTEFMSFQVPLRQAFRRGAFVSLRGKLSLKIKVSQGKSPVTGRGGPIDSDVLKLICDP